MPNKFRELIEEFRSVLGNRILDAVLPPFVFVLVNSLLGFMAAMAAALGLALVLGVIRRRRGESLRFALAGVGSVLLAIGFVWALGRAEGYFLPGLVSGGLTVALCVLSLLIRRPLTAWSSYIYRRWPLNWYWHPRVRPAYIETTLLWTLFFGGRLLWQTNLYRTAQPDTLALVNFLTSWPALVVLLVVTYLYGIWRLQHLEGPSVDEFQRDAQPPWQGQRRGF
jgi:hypothetical protein